MPAARTFVDTNILVYAHNADAGAKHEVARQRLLQLWDDETGVVSMQVLQELYVTVTSKTKLALAPATGRELVRTYRPWLMGPTEVEHVLRASEIQEENQLSFWDALIVASASAAGAPVLLSEDLNHGQVVAGVRVENPFIHKKR